MRRLLLILLTLGIAVVAGGCRNCGLPPLTAQAYVAPACGPCATAAVVPGPPAVVVPGPPRVIAP